MKTIVMLLGLFVMLSSMAANKQGPGVIGTGTGPTRFQENVDQGTRSHIHDPDGGGVSGT